MKSDQEQQFEAWFKEQPFYSQQVFSHGERLFIKDGDDYKFAAVRTAFAAWCHVQVKDDIDKRFSINISLWPFVLFIAAFLLLLVQL